MLERLGLLIGPASWVSETPLLPGEQPRRLPMRRSLARSVCDLHTGEELGVVRSRSSRWSLFGWLRRRHWFVLETEDEALLCSLHSTWGVFRSWDILDAEDRLVCTYSGDYLFDSKGNVGVALEKVGVPGGWTFLGKGGTKLGSVNRTPLGTELVFTPLVRNDPYAKMGLLGATLAATESRIVTRPEEVLANSV